MQSVPKKFQIILIGEHMQFVMQHHVWIQITIIFFIQLTPTKDPTKSSEVLSNKSSDVLQHNRNYIKKISYNYYMERLREGKED